MPGNWIAAIRDGGRSVFGDLRPSDLTRVYRNNFVPYGEVDSLRFDGVQCHQPNTHNRQQSERESNDHSARFPAMGIGKLRHRETYGGHGY